MYYMFNKHYKVAVYVLKTFLNFTFKLHYFFLL